MEKNGIRKLPELLTRSLPMKIIYDYECISRNACGNIEEIRIRLGRRSEFVFSGTSILGTSVVDKNEIGECFFKLCGGSVYAHGEEICYGGMRAEGGIRVGACGRAVVRGGKIEAVHDITSLSIRLPCTVLPSIGDIGRMLSEKEDGALIFSRPGVGKTTFLKAIASDLSGKYGKRVALIDSGGELSAGLFGENMKIDILEEYPRGTGIEIAVRTLNPQFIICDEIGSGEEAAALLSVRSCGVPIIASAHGDNIRELIMRKGIRELHEARLFGIYIHLRRAEGEKNCRYTVLKREDAEKTDDTS